jgi:hypothetical protein
VTPVLSESGLTERYVVELTGLDLRATTAGRELAIGVHSLEQAPQAWVHGASEVPASVTFVPPPEAG